MPSRANRLHQIEVKAVDSPRGTDEAEASRCIVGEQESIVPNVDQYIGCRPVGRLMVHREKECDQTVIGNPLLRQLEFATDHGAELVEVRDRSAFKNSRVRVELQ